MGLALGSERVACSLPCLGDLMATSVAYLLVMGGSYTLSPKT